MCGALARQHMPWAHILPLGRSVGLEHLHFTRVAEREVEEASSLVPSCMGQRIVPALLDTFDDPADPGLGFWRNLPPANAFREVRPIVRRRHTMLWGHLDRWRHLSSKHAVSKHAKQASRLRPLALQ